MKEKKNVLLTGATGVMGSAGLKELVKMLDRINLTLLVRPSEINKKKMAPYMAMPGIRIVWGDLVSYNDVQAAVADVDIVLHVGGMVSPRADHYPRQTLHVNITAAENIVRAVKSRPDADNVRVVYIGSVAQTGHRCPPDTLGSCRRPHLCQCIRCLCHLKV